ncbi:hypothetical protein C2S51_015651 [Perilla frutescens var. frutescens]|nr:hypothetical protein C2S51_015651 [Perilla frutescens var. frutescens]
MDASIDDNRNTGVGIVIRNNRGQVIQAFARSYHFPSVLMAEALARYQGIRLAKEHGLQNLVIEMDSQEFVNILLNKSIFPNYIGDIIIDIHHIISDIHRVNFYWVSRHSNKLAHLPLLDKATGISSDSHYKKFAF